MISAAINVSTGPVQLSPKVLAALSDAPISHRSIPFYDLYADTTNYLCKQVHVAKCYLLTGSGTAANEAMLWQIKSGGGKGLILSNGEFGERLIHQATRIQISFDDIRLTWGQVYDASKVEEAIIQNERSWVLLCHCETSTGVVNDLAAIIEICNRNNCLCFVDCMSTIGVSDLDLSGVAMATASSGKGLASIPGLAIIFSNIPIASSSFIPDYFDLGKYDASEGVPYTLSSNLLNALNVAVKLKFQVEQRVLIDFYANECLHLLKEKNLLPFDNTNSKVFTLALPHGSARNVIHKLCKAQLIIGYESEYLKKRGWCQLALLGYYASAELDFFMKALNRTFPK